ncbi:tRNA threonylcarbamoyladenosine biosynthesis protein RimN [Acinetobacter sp. ANC 4558]|uniref:L-threonylcarbamoyladenylate synthase n=1 Tax=Acinetobacter sp. ANC 4558 TaxID=1977876 RepID=UPI000A34CC41|nr:Sua5/YciO/YrdC/YwlC family protein [Acinetobacter sp. ANC 4558]OTG86798.1 tRNA threonylcarbamoyladenosine biosynthesis protein RimN [Acinetobacter sp. ANC 4558]
MMTTSAIEASVILKHGNVLAYPTEAVWGLGCDPYNERAFQNILKLKERPIEKGVILLAGHISQVDHLLKNLNKDMQKKVVDSWSNRQPTERATTWLLPATDDIPTWIKGNHPKVAIRVTTHPLCIALCHAFNGFIVSTSANKAGLEPARSFPEASYYFKHQVDYLNGDLGRCHEPSQIIDAETGVIIRA